MHRYLASLPIDVYVHPEAARATLPEHQTPDAVQTWLRAHPRDLAFAEVWNDLKSLFAEPTPAERPDAREAFRVHIPSGAESVQITLPDGAVLSIAAEILLPFWQRLRDGGFVQLGSMPDLEQDGVAYLMGVFAALPYVRRVDISPEYDTLGANAPRGLQIISVDAAPEATQQLALFEVG